MNSNNDRTSSTQHPTTEATDAQFGDRQSEDLTPAGPPPTGPAFVVAPTSAGAAPFVERDEPHRGDRRCNAAA